MTEQPPGLLLARGRKAKERSRKEKNVPFAFSKEPNQWEVLTLTKNQHDSHAVSKTGAQPLLLVVKFH